MSFATFWLIVSGACLIAEIFTISFLLFFPGVAAFFSFIAAIFGATFYMQVIIFVISSTLMILFVRPLVAKLFKTKDVAMNSSSIIGKSGIVLKEIGKPNTLGQVKVSGEVWSAISEDSSTILKDEPISVVAISGVKLIVKKV